MAVVLKDPSLNSNQVLRRYMDLAKFTDLLITKKLYLRRVDLLDDKFEGSLTPSLEAAMREAYDLAAGSMSYEKFKRNLRVSTYINCWTEGIHDNMALWKIYGQSNNSIAITTTVGKLEAELISSGDIDFTYVHKVKYLNHWSNNEMDITSFANIFKYKLEAYEYEKEVRIIKYKQENAAIESLSEIDAGLYIDVNLNELLRSIVVSPDSESWFLEVVKDLTRRYGINTEVHQSMVSAKDPF